MGDVVTSVTVTGLGVSDLVREVCRVLERAGVRASAVQPQRASELEGEVLVVVGDDKDVLRFLHSGPLPEASLLIVGLEPTRSFLTSVELEDLAEAAAHLVEGNFRVEQVPLLRCTADEGDSFVAVNEGAVFPKRTATLMGYTLFLDGEPVWGDRADGVLVSTPIGSSAYALSAGGVLIHHDAQVFQVVPINSVDLTRRPLVVSAGSEVRVSEIEAEGGVELVVDGLIRRPVGSEVVFTRSERPLRLIRFPGRPAIAGKMERKVLLAEENLPLPPSARLVRKVLEYRGTMTFEELLAETGLPERTLRYCLSVLVARGVVKRTNDPDDFRRKLYQLRR
ncbi:MAG: ATP-NAD kinase [Nitrososphaerota archaeon]